MAARKSLRQRPLRALASRAPDKASSRSMQAERPATFADAVVGSDIAPLARGTRRVPARRLAAAPPALERWEFSVEEEEGWLSGYRSDLGPSVLAKLRGTPRATLDLHGERAETARRRLAPFLSAERMPARALVLVIVGKG